MTHSSEDAWALEDDHCGRGGDHIARGLCTYLVCAHVLHAAGGDLGLWVDCTVSATTDLL